MRSSKRRSRSSKPRSRAEASRCARASARAIHERAPPDVSRCAHPRPLARTVAPASASSVTRSDRSRCSSVLIEAARASSGADTAGHERGPSKRGRRRRSGCTENNHQIHESRLPLGIRARSLLLEPHGEVVGELSPAFAGRTGTDPPGQGGSGNSDARSARARARCEGNQSARGAGAILRPRVMKPERDS